MAAKSPTAKIIFGLKVKQLRNQRKMSFADLAEASAMSASYLNEIEKGKKYPAAKKLPALAEALGVSIAELQKPNLYGELNPVGELLSSNFLNELPLDLFKIELSRIIEIIAKAPSEVGAFITTLVDIARNYALREENFYFAALRSYLEMHHNYFEDLEGEVEKFVLEYGLKDTLLTSDTLSKILETDFGYHIVEDGLSGHEALSNVRAVFLPKSRRFLLNGGLNEGQRLFQFGKELGFNYLNLKDRALTSSLMRVSSFGQVLNHFKAGYFSAALLIERQAFVRDLREIFEKPVWDGEGITRLMQEYRASPETVFQRMTNLLPQDFGIRKIFFFRFTHDTVRDSFKIDKEIHLDGRHIPHGNGLREHYCRRWLSTSLLADLRKMQREGIYVSNLVGVQRNRYYGEEEEYLIITLARAHHSKPGQNVSVSFGMLIDETLQQQVHFWNDGNIRSRVVNTTCERCPIMDCEVRAADPIVIEKKERRRAVQSALKKLTEER